MLSTLNYNNLTNWIFQMKESHWYNTGCGSYYSRHNGFGHQLAHACYNFTFKMLNGFLSQVLSAQIALLPIGHKKLGLSFLVCPYSVCIKSCNPIRHALYSWIGSQPSLRHTNTHLLCTEVDNIFLFGERTIDDGS